MMKYISVWDCLLFSVNGPRQLTILKLLRLNHIEMSLYFAAREFDMGNEERHGIRPRNMCFTRFEKPGSTHSEMVDL